jgi:hypothetical protein
MTNVISSVKSILNELLCASNVNDIIETLFINLEKLGRDFDPRVTNLDNANSFLKLYLDSSDNLRSLGPRRLM